MNRIFISFAAKVFKIILALRRSFRTLVSPGRSEKHKNKHRQASKIIRRLMASGEQGLPPLG